MQPLRGEIIDGTQRFKKNRPLDPGRAARLSGFRSTWEDSGSGPFAPTMPIGPQKTGCDRPPDSTARNEFRNLTQGRPQPSPPNVAGVARERRVLLIDDDPDLADLYLMQLRRDGIPLEHTRTGTHPGRSQIAGHRWPGLDPALGR